MVDRIAQAAAENAAWCDLVCRAHGIDTAWRPSCWTALRRSPMFYPDAVTLRPDATAADVLDSIDAGAGCSVKDSFATLDLAPHGFEVLFDASWIVREPAPLSALGELDWAPVRDRDELAAWAELHGARDVFVVSLLDQPDIAVLADRRAANSWPVRSPTDDEPVLGVSNLFVTHERWAPRCGPICSRTSDRCNRSSAGNGASTR